MQSSVEIQILAILLISSCNFPLILSQTDDYQLKLGNINTEEVQLQEIKDNEYLLRISSPDSQREETISLEPSDDPSAGPVVVTKGQMDTNFPNENLNLVVNYVADSNGYRASYRIGQGLNDGIGGISFGTRLNIKDLKSLAG